MAAAISLGNAPEVSLPRSPFATLDLGQPEACFVTGVT